MKNVKNENNVNVIDDWFVCDYDLLVLENIELQDKIELLENEILKLKEMLNKGSEKEGRIIDVLYILMRYKECSIRFIADELNISDKNVSSYLSYIRSGKFKGINGDIITRGGWGSKELLNKDEFKEYMDDKNVMGKGVLKDVGYDNKSRDIIVNGKWIKLEEV